MSPVDEMEDQTPESFPRVSGDEPPRGVAVSHFSPFSPRERG